MPKHNNQKIVTVTSIDDIRVQGECVSLAVTNAIKLAQEIKKMELELAHHKEIILEYMEESGNTTIIDDKWGGEVSYHKGNETFTLDTAKIKRLYDEEWQLAHSKIKTTNPYITIKG